LIVVGFFLVHWQVSVFCQTFFLHRYGAHRMFSMSKGWERFFHLFTYVCQGPSYLVPRGYAVLHRMHHAFSDTERDPHSPRNYPNALTMMLATKKHYDDYAYYREQPEARFDGGVPEWRALDRFSQSWVTRIAWIGAYACFYYQFATSPWQWLLLPFQCVLGPIHGAIVNWCGHRYGYSNFENGDDSKNTLPFDFVTLGELFQNNHHMFGMSPNFAARWFEVDPTYMVIRGLAAVGIIRIETSQRARYPFTQSMKAAPVPAVETSALGEGN
jgi:stearoyl-CoA desaturase (Delta-9 desaturase)